MGGVEGAAWSLSGGAFTDWDTIQRTCNPGGYGPSGVRPSLCHVLSCLLPFPGQAPGGVCGGVPAGRGKHGPWGGTGGWGRHSPSFHLCQGRGGIGTALVCRLLGPTVLSRGKVCSGFRGRWTPGGAAVEQQPKSPSRQDTSGQGFRCSLGGCLHPSEGPSPSREKPSRLYLRPR